MRDQIFNPFVTTKKTGVGLGLSIVSKIVDEHHGTIRLESADGNGAGFVISFRRGKEQESSAAVPAAVRRAPAPAEGETPSGQPAVGATVHQ